MGATWRVIGALRGAGRTLLRREARWHAAARTASREREAAGAAGAAGVLRSRLAIVCVRCGGWGGGGAAAIELTRRRQWFEPLSGVHAGDAGSGRGAANVSPPRASPLAARTGAMGCWRRDRRLRAAAGAAEAPAARPGFRARARRSPLAARRPLPWRRAPRAGGAAAAGACVRHTRRHCWWEPPAAARQAQGLGRRGPGTESRDGASAIRWVAGLASTPGPPQPRPLASTHCWRARAHWLPPSLWTPLSGAPSPLAPPPPLWGHGSFARASQTL
jgi:hypothetical protein